MRVVCKREKGSSTGRFVTVTRNFSGPGAGIGAWAGKIFARAAGQSFLTVGSLETLSAKPIGTDVSPMLRIVPACSRS